jgi:hypothetical protein
VLISESTLSPAVNELHGAVRQFSYLPTGSAKTSIDPKELRDPENAANRPSAEIMPRPAPSESLHRQGALFAVIAPVSTFRLA